MPCSDLLEVKVLSSMRMAGNYLVFPRSRKPSLTLLLKSHCHVEHLIADIDSHMFLLA